MTLIWYEKCSTCRKAKAWLDDQGLQYELRPIKEQNPSAQEIAGLHEKSGLPLKKFFNTSGQLYREMELKDKLPGLSLQEQYELLGSDGMLVKRPILEGRDFVLTGFRQPEWQAALDKMKAE